MRNWVVPVCVNMAAACAVASLVAVPILAQDEEAPAPALRGARRPAGPPKPTPRWPDGTVNFVEVTIDDPGAYTAAWTSGFTKTWSPTNELFEYACQGNNFGPELMIGVEGGASRTSSIVP